MPDPAPDVEMISFTGDDFPGLCDALATAATAPDAEDTWPAEQFEKLARHGVLGWVIPAEFGGTDIAPHELVAGYERLARACLLTTFVLTQRNGACQRIAQSDNTALKQSLLPDLAAGKTFATVGISHLTTSRQHVRTPAVAVRDAGGGYVFAGTVPWVTGARYADVIVTGGTLEDGRQLLAAIPTSSEGVKVQSPPRLLGLNGSFTASVDLNDVAVSRDRVLAGPTEHVMKRGRGGGAGSLTTSALAVGAAASSIARLAAEIEKRPELAEVHGPLEAERARLSADLRTASREEGTQEPALSAESIRTRANSLVLRAAQAFLAASKGAGYVAGHPAERAVREAMFFLVWSCPQPVLAATLREFACVLE